MRVSYAVVLLLLTSSAAVADEQQLKDALQHCATIDGSSNRLECYDGLVESVTGPGQTPGPDHWTVKAGTDPINDSPVVVLSLRGSEYQAVLFLTCSQHRPDVAVALRGQIVGSLDPFVWTRFDTAKADKKRWKVSSDNKSATYPGDAKVFIRQLLTTRRLVVQMEHFLRGNVTDVFDVHQLKQAVAPLSAACNID